ncbi:MAG: hypothetical protein H0T89_32125, partial [Deltaproteobacteria bacterium]|nr:hypothetical protein [Deltaproteobacteria bacterium]
GELAALLDSAAAPVAIDIEAASAELARQLGGAAVRRDRSARWAPPPVVEVPKVESAAVAESASAAAAPPEPAAAPPEPVAAAPEPATPAPITAVDEEPFPVALVAAVEAVELDRPQSFAPANVEIHTDPQVSSLIHDDADPGAFAATGAAARADDGDDAQEVEPDQIDDEIHQLAEGDYEEVEHTQLGARPVDPNAFDEHAYATIPSEDQVGLAARLDERLAEAEAEADADDLGIAPASFDRFDDDPGDRMSLDGVPYDERVDAVGDDVIPLGEPRRVTPAADSYAEVDAHADDRALEQALEQDLAGALEQDLTGAPAPAEHVDELDELEELHDFEILAEADAEDEDLLTSRGEREISAAHAANAASDDAQRPSFADFAARLDLDDDDGVHAIPTKLRASFDPREVSAGHALAAFADPEPADEPHDGSFTLPGDVGFDDAQDDYAAAPGFPPLHAFDQSDVISVAPPPPGDVYGGDLESALEQLDVDLDDIAPAPPPTEVRPARARQLPAAERPARAARNRPPSSIDEPVTARSPARLPASPGSSVRSTGKSRLVGLGRVAPLAKPDRPPRATTDDGVLINFDDDDDD